MAHFLIPESANGNPLQQFQSCLDLSPLEDKVSQSDLIVVAKLKPDLSLLQVLKGRELSVNENQFALDDFQNGHCVEQSHQSQVLFLTVKRQSRSFDNHRQALYVPKFQAILAMPKVVEIVEQLVNETQENQALAISTQATQSEMAVPSTTQGKPEFFFFIGDSTKECFEKVAKLICQLQKQNRVWGKRIPQTGGV